MADAGDLRKKHEELREKVARARETLLEARAKQRSLDDRIQELTKELQALGVDPEKLDDAIAAEEAAIGKELAEIEAQLINPTTTKPTTKSTEPATSAAPVSHSSPVSEADLDDLLNVGSS